MRKHVEEDTPGVQWRASLDRVGKVDQVIKQPLALPSPQPVEKLTIKSMTAHKPSTGQPILETRIERITVKVPPLTYAQVAEQVNKGY